MPSTSSLAAGSSGRVNGRVGPEGRRQSSAAPLRPESETTRRSRTPLAPGVSSISAAADASGTDRVTGNAGSRVQVTPAATTDAGVGDTPASEDAALAR